MRKLRCEGTLQRSHCSRCSPWCRHFPAIPGCSRIDGIAKESLYRRNGGTRSERSTLQQMRCWREQRWEGERQKKAALWYVTASKVNGKTSQSNAIKNQRCVKYLECAAWCICKVVGAVITNTLALLYISNDCIIYFYPCTAVSRYLDDGPRARQDQSCPRSTRGKLVPYLSPVYNNLLAVSRKVDSLKEIPLF